MKNFEKKKYQDLEFTVFTFNSDAIRMSGDASETDWGDIPKDSGTDDFD